MLNALQINQKNYTLSIFPSSNRGNFEVLVVSVSGFYQSIAVQLCHPTLGQVYTINVFIDLTE